MKRGRIVALALAGLISISACGGEEGAGADGSVDEMGSDTTSTGTDGTGIAGQGGMNDTVGMGQGPVGQSVPSDTGGFGAGEPSGAVTTTPPPGSGQ
jgi:hypothetical protein